MPRLVVRKGYRCLPGKRREVLAALQRMDATAAEAGWPRGRYLLVETRAPGEPDLEVEFVFESLAEMEQLERRLREHLVRTARDAAGGGSGGAGSGSSAGTSGSFAPGPDLLLEPSATRYLMLLDDLAQSGGPRRTAVAEPRSTSRPASLGVDARASASQSRGPASSTLAPNQAAVAPSAPAPVSAAPPGVAPVPPSYDAPPPFDEPPPFDAPPPFESPPPLGATSRVESASPGNSPRSGAPPSPNAPSRLRPQPPSEAAPRRTTPPPAQPPPEPDLSPEERRRRQLAQARAALEHAETATNVSPELRGGARVRSTFKQGPDEVAGQDGTESEERVGGAEQEQP